MSQFEPIQRQKAQDGCISVFIRLGLISGPCMTSIRSMCGPIIESLALAIEWKNFPIVYWKYPIVMADYFEIMHYLIQVLSVVEPVELHTADVQLMQNLSQHMNEKQAFSRGSEGKIHAERRFWWYIPWLEEEKEWKYNVLEGKLFSENEVLEQARNLCFICFKMRWIGGP